MKTSVVIDLLKEFTDEDYILEYDAYGETFSCIFCYATILQMVPFTGPPVEYRRQSHSEDCPVVRAQQLIIQDQK